MTTQPQNIDPTEPTDTMLDPSHADAASARNSDEWMALLYDELRRLAHARMRRQRDDHTLQPTALLHEAYARMKRRKLHCANRAHFYYCASRAMRDVLVEYARQRASQRRGGDLERVTCTTSILDERETMTIDEVLSVNRVLERLHTHNPDCARLVMLRYFGDLSVREVAHMTGMPQRTVERMLRVARAWLKGELQADNNRAPAHGPGVQPVLSGHGG